MKVSFPPVSAIEANIMRGWIGFTAAVRCLRGYANPTFLVCVVFLMLSNSQAMRKTRP